MISNLLNFLLISYALYGSFRLTYLLVSCGHLLISCGHLLSSRPFTTFALLGVVLLNCKLISCSLSSYLLFNYLYVHSINLVILSRGHLKVEQLDVFIFNGMTMSGSTLAIQVAKLVCINDDLRLGFFSNFTVGIELGQQLVINVGHVDKLILKTEVGLFVLMQDNSRRVEFTIFFSTNRLFFKSYIFVLWRACSVENMPVISTFFSNSSS